MGVNKINVNNTDSNYTHSIFDISEYSGKTYETLSDALADVPTEKQSGGMTIRYISDKKYVQFRYMESDASTAATFTNVANWQGVDDEPNVGSRNLVESGVVFNELMGINGSININRATSGGSVGTWELEGHSILVAGKTYNVLSTEDTDATTSFNLFDEQKNKVYSTNISRNRSITITPSVDIFRITGYIGGRTLNMIITEDGNILEVLNNNVSNVVKLQDDLGSYTDIEHHASSGSSVGSWELYKELKSGRYKLINDTYSYTSLVFYNKDNAEIYRNDNIPRGIETIITLQQDAVRIAGYSNNTQYGLVKLKIISENSVHDRIFDLETDLDKTNISIDALKDDIWEVNGAFTHVYIAPDSDSSVGPWRIDKDFKAGTYLVKNAIGSYSSLVFYDKHNSEIFRNDGLQRDTTIEIILAQDAVSVRGYTAVTDSIVNIVIVGKDTIDARLETLEENKDICVLNPPNVYDDIVYNNFRSKRINGGLKKLFTLIHFSDIHGIEGNVTRLLKFAERYKNGIDDIICTGDIVSDRYEDTNILDNYPNILALIGNHDAWLRTYDAELAEYQSGPWVVKQSYCYDKFIANSVANWEVIQPSDVETTKKCYYYKDYQQEDSKLRVICLDCMHYNIGADLDGNNSIQNAWLADVLTDAKNNNIPVVIAVHYWPVGVNLANEEVIKCAYSNTDSIASDYLPIIAIQTVQSFIDNGGEFVCWIVGHAHCDLIAAPRDYPKQMFITVDCATYVNSVGNSARVKNTKSQDCFNIITFDTYDKLVKVVRVGSDTTRQLKQKRVLAYRYAPITDDAGILHNIGLEYCG